MKGQINAALQGVVIDCPGGATHASVDLRGTWSGTLVLQQSMNGTDWVTIPSSSILRHSTLDQTNGLVSASTDAYTAPLAAGATKIRIYATAWSSGLVIVELQGVKGAIVQVGSGEAHLGEVGGRIATPSANFTRPNDTTAYASGDLVANSTTAGSVSAMSWTAARVAAGSFFIRRLKFRKSGTSTTNASFRVHLLLASPATITNGDNGAFSVSGVADYIGAFDVTADRAFTDGAYGTALPISGSEINVKLASGQTIYGLIEARAAYTPSAQEVFTVDLEIQQN